MGVRVSSSSHKQMNAEIAQLVEHNLAKVGVASSSLVFRSKSKFDFSVLRRRYRPISGIFFCFQKVEQESGLSIFLHSISLAFQIFFSAFWRMFGELPANAP